MISFNVKKCQCSAAAAIIVLALLSSLVASAQHTRPTSFGFTGGLNRSAINGKELNGLRAGYVGLELYVAVFAETKLTDKWKFSNELLFSYTDDYHFAEFPLRFKRLVYKNIFVTAGPKLDFVLDNDDEIYDFNNFGVSFEFGAQYDVTTRVLLEIRYAKGLVPQVNDISLEIYDARRNTLRLGMGYRF